MFTTIQITGSRSEFQGARNEDEEDRMTMRKWVQVGLSISCSVGAFIIGTVAAKSASAGVVARASSSASGKNSTENAVDEAN